MAEEHQRLDVPATLNALDQAVYTDDGGVPASSFLGTTLAKNDRCLHANLRRTLVAESFSVPAPSRTAFYQGISLGTVPLPCTTGIKQAEIYLRMAIESGGKVRLIPYTYGFTPPPDAIDMVNDARVTTITDSAGGSEATYGPHLMDLRAQWPPLIGGIILAATVDAGTSATAVAKSGAAFYWGAEVIIFTAGVATVPAAVVANPDRYIIRPLDAGSNPVGPWRDVLGYGVDGTTEWIDIWPPWTNEEIGGALGWRSITQFQFQKLFYVDLYSYSIIEKPLSGSLGSL
mgnify:CR=1 FL=1